MVDIPKVPNTVEPRSAEYVPHQQVPNNDSEMFDALNGGHYPQVQTLENDAIYRFKSPNIKNT